MSRCLLVSWLTHFCRHALQDGDQTLSVSRCGVLSSPSTPLIRVLPDFMPFFRKRSQAPAVPAQPRLPEGLRVYAIGDVHGRSDLLADAFARIDRNEAEAPSQRNLTIILGDMIDRGSDSRGVVNHILARAEKHWLVAMRGNHEQCLIEFLDDPDVLEFWGGFGAFNTLLSYGVRPVMNPTAEQREQLHQEFVTAVPPEHLAFFRDLPMSFTCHGYVFVHAGLKPGVPISQQVPEDLLWIREEFLSSRGPFERIVVHGHTPVLEPELLPHRINIDTGAYATGRLTCVLLEGSQVRVL